MLPALEFVTVKKKSEILPRLQTDGIPFMVHLTRLLQ
jgi:hypothetical protein